MTPENQNMLNESDLSRVTGGASGPSSVEYTVKPGDTLASVASRYHVAEEQIRELNRLSGDALYAGQRLKIPVPIRATRASANGGGC